MHKPLDTSEPDLCEPDAFARVYDNHHRSVFAAAHRILGNAAQAEDVTQDVFLRLWRRPERFDARRGELGGYLRLMARSRALDLYRSDQALSRASDRLETAAQREEGRVEDRPAAATERREERATVREALRGLPGSQRQALVLAYWGGMTADEIAHLTRVPVGTAKSRIRLGLGKLRGDSQPALI